MIKPAFGRLNFYNRNWLLSMGIFGLVKRSGRRSVGKPASKQKVEFRPSIVYSHGKPVHTRHKTGSRKSGFKLRTLIAALLGVALVLSLCAGLVSILQSDRLAVKNFRLLGNMTVTDNQVLEIVAQYRERNILLVNATGIEQELKAKFNVFNGVEVQKYFPDTLFIKISEREPQLVYINLSGAYLIDSNGLVLDPPIYIDPVSFPDEKINIARGLGDPTSEFLKEQFLNDFILKNDLNAKTLEEKQAAIVTGFRYEEVLLNEKLLKLAQLQRQFLKEFNADWDKKNQAVDNSSYQTYPRVNVLETKLLNGNETVGLARLPLTLELQQLFTARKLPITRTVWEGEILVKLITPEEKSLVFGLERDITEQFEDFLLVTSELASYGRDYCQIDVSASKIAVRQCR